MRNLLIQVYKVIFHLVGLILPKDKELVVFESFLGKQYSDNPRAIFEYLQEHQPHLKLIWSVDGKSITTFQAHHVKYVKRLSIKWLFLMNRAKYWVSNSRLPLWLPKSRSTVYLQTWHGTPLKRLAMDMDEVHMAGVETKRYKREFMDSVSKWDYLISPNAYSSRIFVRAFQYKKELLETGYPRNDYLVNQNNPQEMIRIKKRMALPQDKKVILYAPTWRDNQFTKIGHYTFNIPIDLKLMKEKLGHDYIIVLRMHYLVVENLDISGLEGFVYDASYYEDIRELYMIADLLVTDYSSVFFDYAILQRPMIFYVHDMDEYRDQLRGLYIDFEKEAPGPLVKTTTELIQTILSDNLQAYQDTSFYEKYCSLEDGQACKRVVERVF